MILILKNVPMKTKGMPLPTQGANQQAMLVVVLGLPGTGKTTFAQALALALGARHFNTDIIRDELGMRGEYSAADKQRVYQKMESQAVRALMENLPVVVDGTFYLPPLRQSYQQIGRRHRIPVFWILVQAPEDLVKSRLSQKRDYSEADYEVYLKIKTSWLPLEYQHLALESEDLEAMVEKALAYLCF